MLVEDAQPRKLENMLEVQDADTVGSTAGWAPLGARALAHHLSKLSRCKCQRTLEVGALWSECGAMAGTMNLPTSARTKPTATHRELLADAFSARASREDPRSREGVSNLVDWNPRTSWHEDQGGPQKARRPPNVGGDRGAEKWLFRKATSLPSFDGTWLERNSHDRDRRKFRARSVSRG